MIDLRAARNDPDAVRAALARKGAAELFDELMSADRAVLDVQPQAEELRAKRKLKGKPTAEQLAELEQVKVELQRLEEELGAAEARRKELLDRIPNPPAEDTPDGFTDDDAVEIARVGRLPSMTTICAGRVRCILACCGRLTRGVIVRLTVWVRSDVAFQYRR